MSSARFWGICGENIPIANQEQEIEKEKEYVTKQKEIV